MKGLLKNNFFTVCANAKVFSVFMLIVGFFIVVVRSQSFQIVYAMIGIVGFSVNAAAVVKNEFISKWGKYKLTLPVRRADIIKSYFINQIIWLFAGTLFVGMETCISWLVHGSPFDQPFDALTMAALGISISFFMGAMFFPFFYLGGAERSDVFLGISLLCAFGIDLMIVTFLNELLEPGLSTILLGAGVLVLCSLLAFGISYLLTVRIYMKMEY